MTYEWEAGWDEEDPGHVWATIDVPADYFSCPTCRLVLDGYDLIVQADLPDQFTEVDNDPPPEQEYGND